MRDGSAMPPLEERMMSRPDGAALTGLVIRAARATDAEGVAAIAALPGFRHGTPRLPCRSPEETRRFVQAEMEKWGDAARKAGIQPQAAG